jgi:hypothetical protein
MCCTTFGVLDIDGKETPHGPSWYRIRFKNETAAHVKSWGLVGQWNRQADTGVYAVHKTLQFRSGENQPSWQTYRI